MKLNESSKTEATRVKSKQQWLTQGAGTESVSAFVKKSLEGIGKNGSVKILAPSQIQSKKTKTTIDKQGYIQWRNNSALKSKVKDLFLVYPRTNTLNTVEDFGTIYNTQAKTEMTLMRVSSCTDFDVSPPSVSIEKKCSIGNKLQRAGSHSGNELNDPALLAKKLRRTDTDIISRAAGKSNKKMNILLPHKQVKSNLEHIK